MLNRFSLPKKREMTHTRVSVYFAGTSDWISVFGISDSNINCYGIPQTPSLIRGIPKKKKPFEMLLLILISTNSSILDAQGVQETCQGLPLGPVRLQDIREFQLGDS